MNRRTLMLASVGLLAPVPAWRAMAAGPVRLGQVIAGASSAGGLAQVFEKGLGDLGLVKGRIYTLRTSFVVADPKAMRDAILDLLPEVDVLVVWGTIGATAAKSVAPRIPVVFLSVGAPVEIGLVESLSRPGGNMTGITFEASSETYAKRLQLLKEILPTLSRVAVLGAKGDANVPFALRAINEAAPRMNTSVQALEFGSADDLKAAFAEVRRNSAEALIVVAGALTLNERRPIVNLALAERLPSCHGFSAAVAAGGLVSLGPDLNAIARQGARLVAKIIEGSRPATLPVEQPTDYTIAVNLGTARTLGLVLPPALVARANETFE